MNKCYNCGTEYSMTLDRMHLVCDTCEIVVY